MMIPMFPIDDRWLAESIRFTGLFGAISYFFSEFDFCFSTSWLDFKKLFLRMSPARILCRRASAFSYWTIVFFFSSTKIIQPSLYSLEREFFKKGVSRLFGKKGDSYWLMGIILCLWGYGAVGCLPLGVAVSSCAPDICSESETWDRIKFALSWRHEHFISKFITGIRRTALSTIKAEACRPGRPRSGLVGWPAKSATWFCADNWVLRNVRLKWVSLWGVSLRNDFGHFRLLIRKRPLWRIHFLLLDGHFSHIGLERVHLVWNRNWCSERRELKRVIWCYFLLLLLRLVSLEVGLDDSEAFFFCDVSQMSSLIMLVDHLLVSVLLLLYLMLISSLIAISCVLLILILVLLFRKLFLLRFVKRSSDSWSQKRDSHSMKILVS